MEHQLYTLKSSIANLKTKLIRILFVNLVSDDILQMALGSDLLRKFVQRILHSLLTNTICCTLRQLLAMPLSTKRILKNSLYKKKQNLQFSCMNCWIMKRGCITLLKQENQDCIWFPHLQHHPFFPVFLSMIYLSSSQLVIFFPPFLKSCTLHGWTFHQEFLFIWL